MATLLLDIELPDGADIEAAKAAAATMVQSLGADCKTSVAEPEPEPPSRVVVEFTRDGALDTAKLLAALADFAERRNCTLGILSASEHPQASRKKGP